MTQKRNSISYSTQGAPANWSDLLPHVHADISKKETSGPTLLQVAKTFEEHGCTVAIDDVSESIIGEQHDKEEETYRSHDVNSFGSFMTIAAKDRNDAILNINRLARIYKGKDAVIEGEQPVGLFRGNKWELLIPESIHFPRILPGETMLTSLPSLGFEWHDSFFIETEEDTPPLDLERVRDGLAANGVIMGGIFLFPKENGWCYTTNFFTNDVRFMDGVEKRNYAINKFLVSEGYQGNAETLVENIYFIGRP